MHPLTAFPSTPNRRWRDRPAFAAPGLAFGILLACTGDRARDAAALGDAAVVVTRDASLRATDYTVTSAGCTITWTSYETDANRGVVRHRSDCALALGDQAVMIAPLLRTVVASHGDPAEFRTLSWGRLSPDGARDVTMSARLALAASRSDEWDPARGAPSGGDVNGWVRNLANAAMIYAELRPVFLAAGLDLEVTAVEKVLVMPAGQLPFFPQLRAAGVRQDAKLPFDCQTWFAVKPVRATGDAP